METIHQNGQFTQGWEFVQSLIEYRDWMKATVVKGGNVKDNEQQLIRSLTAILDDYPVNSYFPSQREKRLLQRVGKLFRAYTSLRCNMMTSSLRDPFNPVMRRVRQRTALSPGTDCQLWTGTMAGGAYPYPVMQIDNQQRAVRRVIWEDSFGPIPEKMRVTTTCKEGRCIAPDHMMLMLKGNYVSGESYMHALEKLEDQLRKQGSWIDRETMIESITTSPLAEHGVRSHGLSPDDYERMHQAQAAKKGTRICKTPRCFHEINASTRYVYCTECRGMRQEGLGHVDYQAGEAAVSSLNVTQEIEQQTRARDEDEQAGAVIDLDDITPNVSNPNQSIDEIFAGMIEPNPHRRDSE